MDARGVMLQCLERRCLHEVVQSFMEFTSHETTSYFQGRRPLDLKENYKRGCQKIEDLTLKFRTSEDTSDDTSDDTSFRRKSTVQRASVDFAICRVF